MAIGMKQAYVFSSFARETVEKHFEWMKTMDRRRAAATIRGRIASSHAKATLFCET